ncbi:transcriptional regulator [Streptomyces sp. NBC_01310]|nr:transcriptional regulator [Streptomyces sp. NBC_01310]
MLGAVLDHGPVARSTIARLTGLSPASVSGHCAALRDRGLVREGPETAGPRGLGRPYVPVEIDTSRFLVAGAHIAVPHTTLSPMDLTGRIVVEERRPHEGTEPGRVLARVAAGLPRLPAAHGAGRTALALGVAPCTTARSVRGRHCPPSHAPAAGCLARLRAAAGNRLRATGNRCRRGGPGGRTGTGPRDHGVLYAQ